LEDASQRQVGKRPNTTADHASPCMVHGQALNLLVTRTAELLNPTPFFGLA
jgi:hypothetical protein